MRFLLTGAAGFIGSHLADRLISEGHQVTGVDSLITGNIRNIEHLKNEPGFSFVEHDVVSPIKISSPIDWILHFASPASPPKFLEHPIEILRVNSEGTYHLLELARAKNAKFFFASTSEIYGDPQVHPQPETYWGNVNPIGLRSVYNEGKRFSEAMVTAFRRKYSLSTRLIRIFNTYGPRMEKEDGRVVSNFINQALKNEPITVYGNGQQTRSFQYVEDLVEGIVRLMKSEYYEPVNLGNCDEFKVLDLAKMVCDLTESSSLINFQSLPHDDPKQRKPDISLAKRLLDWEPKILLRPGLLRTIDYYKSLE